MGNLRNCSIFLALLCTFLISDTFCSPIHGKKGYKRCHHKYFHKRAVDGQPQIVDFPSKMSPDYPLVKFYAQKGVEKLAETSTGPTDPLLENILDATLFDPAGKLLYEIKIKVGSEKTKDVSQQCTVNVWRESDAEPSVTVECAQARRRRSDDGEPEIADLPTTLSIDDPKVKKYAQLAVDKMGAPSTGMKGFVKEIVEAKSYPPSGKLLYTVKLKIGSTKCPKDSNEQNCEHDAEAGDANCEISVFKETDEEDSTSVQCWMVARRRRDAKKAFKLPNWPKNVSIDEPDVKKYAQNAVDGFGTPIDEDKKAILREIKQAVLYSRNGKDSYQIKMRVGVTNCTKGSEETNCEHNPEEDDVDCELYISIKKETGEVLSEVIECIRAAREKREVTESDPQIADLPTTLSNDDPKVKKYAQMAVDKIGGHSSGMKGIVREIVEAKSYPPSGKLLYTVKLKVGSTKCPKDSNEKNCEYDPEAGDDNCEISVFKETDEEDSTAVQCWRVDRRRRATDGIPEIADLPTKSSVDDPQVKKYAEKGVEKLAETSTGPTDPVLEKILEATFFPPAGKLLYEIKMKVASKKTKDVSQECKVNVWRESDAEPSVTVECGNARRRRADGQPQIADLPTKSSVEDPQVKKYAEKGIQKLAETSTGPTDPVLEKILEATFFPPAGKLLYEIKMKVASKKTKDVSQECKVNVWRESDAEPSVTVECGQARRRRANDDDDDDDEKMVGPLILDQPLQVSIDNPEVKKYAQKGVEIYAESSTGPNEPILEEIEEALMFPPVGTMLFQIKIKIGTSTCAKGQKENCELKADGESKPCTVKVFIESEKPRVVLECN